MTSEKIEIISKYSLVAYNIRTLQNPHFIVSMYVRRDVHARRNNAHIRYLCVYMHVFVYARAFFLKNSNVQRGASTIHVRKRVDISGYFH